MTGVSYATSAEMAGELGPFPEYAANKDAMLRVIRNHRRAAHGEAGGYEKLAIAPVALDLAGHRAEATWPMRPGAPGTMRCDLGKELRLPQRPGDRDRAHRHHRPGDGLRHHRRRAGFRAGQVQDPGGRRLFQDHQPLRARSPGQSGLWPAGDRRHRRLCRGPRHAGGLSRAASITTPCAARASARSRSAQIEAALESAFDIRFVFNKWTLGDGILHRGAEAGRGQRWTRPISTC